MNPSAIRDIVKLTERPGIVSLAGGLRSPDGFLIDAMRAASERLLLDAPRSTARGAAFVSGAAFHARDAKPNTLRLSFATVAPDLIVQGIAAPAAAIGEMK